MAVAWARALATQGHGRVRIDDRFAAELLPARFRALLALTKSSNPLSSAIGVALDGVSFGMVEHLAMRTRAIDGVVERAVAGGATQLVVLGAGLDTRAHRLALAGCDVFEVDHPATQRLKQKGASHLPLASRSLHYVSVDFAHESFSKKLLAAGFQPRMRSIWIWEGVTMYLHEDAVLQSMQAIGQLAESGSTLAMTYFLSDEGRRIGNRIRVGRVGLRALGEPIHFQMSHASARSALSRAGFEMISDAGDEEWFALDGISPARSNAFLGERLAISTRRSG